MSRGPNEASSVATAAGGRAVLDAVLDELESTRWLILIPWKDLAGKAGGREAVVCRYDHDVRALVDPMIEGPVG